MVALSSSAQGGILSVQGAILSTQGSILILQDDIVECPSRYTTAGFKRR